MARICPLFSGSEGNSTYVSACGSALLVDAGASFKALSGAICACGGNIDEIKGVLITHEHTDHIKGLKVLLKSTGLPVYASAETLDALSSAGVLPGGAEAYAISGCGNDIGGICVDRFETSHDCVGSSGYAFCFENGSKAAVCTDLGVVTDGVRRALSGCQTVLIEANHNIEMLKSGPYPPQLKMRILSDKGHLSNDSCAAELPGLLKSGVTRIILGHISRNNNTPLLALSSARASLADIGAKENSDYILCAAAPKENGVILF